MSLYSDLHGPGVSASGPPGLVLVTPPAVEPVTLDEAKAYLRVETADEDALITRLIAAARHAAERATGRAFITQGWRMTLDRWPSSRVIELPFPPLQSVDTVVLIDEADAETVWPAQNTVADTATEPGRLALRDGVAPPLPGRDIAGLAVDFTAGYGVQSTDVPEALRQAMIRLVAHWFEHRDEAGPLEVPGEIGALLAPYRVAQL
ncbi:MAG: head-tail connector protein [Alphaproteobacteria bacterium]